MKILHFKKWFKVARQVIHCCFCQIDTNLWLSGKGELQLVSQHSFNFSGVLKFSSALCHFAIHCCFCQIDTYLWLSGKGELQLVSQHRFNFSGVLKFSSALCHFGWDESVRVMTRALLYCPVLKFRQWQSRTNRVLTLNRNILVPLFWSTWSWAWARRPHAWAWHMGSYYSDCIAQAQYRLKSLGHCFPLIYREYKKRRCFPSNSLFSRELSKIQKKLSFVDWSLVCNFRTVRTIFFFHMKMKIQ